MNCVYCNRCAIGRKDVVIIKGKGPSHLACKDRYEVDQGKFKNINIRKLEWSQLSELVELVKAEINCRIPSVDKDICLF